MRHVHTHKSWFRNPAPDRTRRTRSTDFQPKVAHDRSKLSGHRNAINPFRAIAACIRTNPRSDQMNYQMTPFLPQDLHINVTLWAASQETDFRAEFAGGA